MLLCGAVGAVLAMHEVVWFFRLGWYDHIEGGFLLSEKNLVVFNLSPLSVFWSSSFSPLNVLGNGDVSDSW